MRLEIRRRGVKVTEELRDYLRGRLRPALGRFGRHIVLVRVYLRDVNGPRSGPGKKCRIVVELPPRGRVVVTGAAARIRAAIAGTANRAGVAVKRYVKRRRARRHPPGRRVWRTTRGAVTHRGDRSQPGPSGASEGLEKANGKEGVMLLDHWNALAAVLPDDSVWDAWRIACGVPPVETWVARTGPMRHPLRTWRATTGKIGVGAR